MKKIIFAFLLIILALVTTCLAQDSLTITTYYPSPYGSYSELQLSPHTPPVATCNANARGTLYYDSGDNNLKICNGSSWINVGGTTVQPTGDVNASNNTWGACSWRTVPSGSRTWTCNNGEFVAGIGYEGSVWTDVNDNEIWPEVEQLYCCKI